jgi:hypothetical protein
MVIVLQRRFDPILGAQVAQEYREDQSVGLVARHFHEPSGTGTHNILELETPKELHLEQTARLGARHPGGLAAPRAGRREGFELGVHPFEALVWQAVQAVMEDPPHAI